MFTFVITNLHSIFKKNFFNVDIDKKDKIRKQFK